MEYGLAAGHIVTVASKGTEMYYVDPTNEQLAKIENLEQEIADKRVYQVGKVLHGRTAVPYRYVIPIRPEQSPAVSINNIKFLLKEAGSNPGSFASEVAGLLNLNTGVSYDAMALFIPKIPEVQDTPEWQDEKRHSKSVEGQLATEYVPKVIIE